MELRDSRRLTGPNFIWERPGAVLDVLLTEDEVRGVAAGVVSAWQLAAEAMLQAVGWEGEEARAKEVRTATEDGRVAPGLSLALSAPLDGLYAACSINEWALDAAVAALSGASDDERAADFETAKERLKAEVEAEARPSLLALRRRALDERVAFLSDDDVVSVGMGRGSKSWPVDQLPDAGSVDWAAVHDVPHVVVTGTNGKSTTVRLLAAMASAAGEVPGISSTDFVRVGDDVLDTGDWSGPGGGRMLLRDARVTLGLLETARGGMMRRGLALEQTDLAVVLNVDTDHLTEWGTPDLASLAEAKFIPVRVAKTAVLNADDEEIVAAYERGLVGSAELVWFSLDAKNPLLQRHLKGGGRGAWCADGTLFVSSPTGSSSDGDLAALSAVRVAEVADIPMTLGGAARYNVANALAAVAAGLELGLSLRAIASGLTSFESGPTDNPGRLNRFELGGVTALVDFAHNPGGFAALFAAAAALPAERRLVLVGQAGDRDEASTRGMARAAVEAGLDHIVIKELTLHLRGRELGELPAIFEDELRRLGLDESRFTHAPSELDAVRFALEWARPGDLLILLAHDARDETLALVQGLVTKGWQPGQPVA